MLGKPSKFNSPIDNFNHIVMFLLISASIFPVTLSGTPVKSSMQRNFNLPEKEVTCLNLFFFLHLLYLAKLCKKQLLTILDTKIMLSA